MCSRPPGRHDWCHEALTYRVQNVRMLPNPCVLSIGGLRVGASSVDVLKQLSGEQFVKPLAQGGVAGDAYVNLCRQVLNQRRCVLFCPITSRHKMDVHRPQFLSAISGAEHGRGEPGRDA